MNAAEQKREQVRHELLTASADAAVTISDRYTAWRAGWLARGRRPHPHPRSTADARRYTEVPGPLRVSFIDGWSARGEHDRALRSNRNV